SSPQGPCPRGRDHRATGLEIARCRVTVAASCCIARNTLPALPALTAKLAAISTTCTTNISRKWLRCAVSLLQRAPNSKSAATRCSAASGRSKSLPASIASALSSGLEVPSATRLRRCNDAKVRGCTTRPLWGQAGKHLLVLSLTAFEAQEICLPALVPDRA